MRIRDWRSDVCSSDRFMNRGQDPESEASKEDYALQVIDLYMQDVHDVEENGGLRLAGIATPHPTGRVRFFVEGHRSRRRRETRSEEHTSELQSLMRISYAVFCLKKKQHHNHIH